MDKKEKKTVKVDFSNPEGRMKLTVKGKKAVEQSIKIMETFDNACKEIREEDRETPISRKKNNTEMI